MFLFLTKMYNDEQTIDKDHFLREISGLIIGDSIMLSIYLSGITTSSKQ